MRVDVLSIFPDYLSPLGLSLPGKAREAGLLDLRVHDLRAWTHDRHHTVDDTPYGGGAGMVMKPEPWGEALDEVAPDGATLVVPTPSGEPFTQRLAEEFATRAHLVFACGRYEGIDARVFEYAATRLEVREVSLGDYVLNGGEVAAMAVIEATIRLLPGFMGNAASIVEESHSESGLLEYPVFTKPASWRGLEVPEVLLSGNHGRIQAWRHDQSLRRTTQRRPDLLHSSQVGEWEITPAVPADAPEILVLQRACWMQEAIANDHLGIPALHETLAEVQEWLGSWRVSVVRAGGRLVGAVRARQVGDDWDLGRIMVAPDVQGRGLGRLLLEHAERQAPEGVRRIILFTGARSEDNLRMYQKAGYRRIRDDHPTDGGAWAERVLLAKQIRY